MAAGPAVAPPVQTQVCPHRLQSPPVELRAFARAWLAHPCRVGAILPTSAAAVTAILDLAGDQTWRAPSGSSSLPQDRYRATVAVGDQLAARQTPVVVIICN